MVTGLDVSERARHEDELQRQRDFLTIVGNQTPALLCVVDSTGTVSEARGQPRLHRRDRRTTTTPRSGTRSGSSSRAPEHAEALGPRSSRRSRRGPG